VSAGNAGRGTVKRAVSISATPQRPSLEVNLSILELPVLWGADALRYRSQWVADCRQQYRIQAVPSHPHGRITLSTVESRVSSRSKFPRFPQPVCENTVEYSRCQKVDEITSVNVFVRRPNGWFVAYRIRSKLDH
jgi:hypothetical protein